MSSLLTSLVASKSAHSLQIFTRRLKPFVKAHLAWTSAACRDFARLGQ